MLAAKSLVYPGAIEAERTYSDAINGRTIHGNPIDMPVELNIHYRVEGPLDIEPIRRWYRDQLTADSWTTERFADAEHHVVMRTIRGDLEHKIIVETYGAKDKYAFRYQIRPS